MRPVAGLIALFFSMPLTGNPDPLKPSGDWYNLYVSGVRRVMLDMYVSATDEVLSILNKRGYSVILRVNQADADSKAPTQVASDLRDKKKTYPCIDWVILFNEPDLVAKNMQYGSPDWMLSAAHVHQSRFSVMAKACAAVGGVRIATPGWLSRTKTEDDPPQPGVTSWERICAPAYEQDGVQGHARHIYLYGFGSEVDTFRIRWQLREAKEPFHAGPILIDEIGCDHLGPLERMRQFIEIMKYLEPRPALLNRVALICPFVSNGTGKGYPPEYVMSAPQCHEELGAWVKS